MNNFKKYRLMKKLGQKDVAKLLNVKVAAVSQWEQGIYYPSSSRLLEIAKLYGCTTDDLLRDTDPTEKK